jgi:sarcosine oxidase subunit beta
MNSYDVIIIGAGSIGVPLAMFLAEEKLKVLVTDSMPSVGQGQNKAAIGGIRATHSDGSKIKTALKSLEIFSTWKENYGQDIGWRKGGYCFPIYTEPDEKMMKDLLKVQKSFGLDIDYLDRKEIKKMIPFINESGLRGGTFSPGDGSASPLLSINAFYKRALNLKVKFIFHETVTGIFIEKNTVKGVGTSKNKYFAPVIVNAAGANAKEIGKMVHIDLPVHPDCHEAGITEPVERFLGPMIVDVRITENSKNYYFYQNSENQVVFCLTPNPVVWGVDRNSTSGFLIEISKKMINICPCLANIKVRRIWRGLYPMTPDGFPIVDFPENPKGFVLANGMCGQGFMLGPGLGKILSKTITNSQTKEDIDVLKGFKLSRNWTGQEKLK